MAAGETVKIIRKPKVDKLKPTSGPTVEFEIRNVQVLPRASREAEQGYVQISGYTVIVKKKAIDVRPDDQIVVRGETHSVIGQPGVFRKGTRTKATFNTTDKV